MIRTLALAAALGLSTFAFATQTSPEAQVNARLDAQLHSTLHRLAVRAAQAELASAQPGTRLGRPASDASRLLEVDPVASQP